MSEVLFLNFEKSSMECLVKVRVETAFSFLSLMAWPSWFILTVSIIWYFSSLVRRRFLHPLSWFIKLEAKVAAMT